MAEASLPLVKRKIYEFRQELLQLAEAEAAPERVVQLNLQLFPLSQRLPAGRKQRKERT